MGESTDVGGISAAQQSIIGLRWVSWSPRMAENSTKSAPSLPSESLCSKPVNNTSLPPISQLDVGCLSASCSRFTSPEHLKAGDYCFGTYCASNHLQTHVWMPIGEKELEMKEAVLDSMPSTGTQEMATFKALVTQEMLPYQKPALTDHAGSLSADNKPCKEATCIEGFVFEASSSLIDRTDGSQVRARHKIRKDSTAKLRPSTSKITEKSPQCLEGQKDGGSALAKKVFATLDQRNALERSFQSNKLPSREARERLAKQINLTGRFVEIWFQNRRAKERRFARHSESSTVTVQQNFHSNSKKRKIGNDVKASKNTSSCASKTRLSLRRKPQANQRKTCVPSEPNGVTRRVQAFASPPRVRRKRRKRRGDSLYIGSGITLICKECTHSEPIPEFVDGYPVLPGDGCFLYRCPAHSSSRRHEFARLPRGWTQVVLIALYNLQCSKSQQSYFHVSKEICTFIDQNWESIATGRKRTLTWHSTVRSILSTRPKFFESSYTKEPGYYRLKQQPSSGYCVTTRYNEFVVVTANNSIISGVR